METSNVLKLPQQANPVAFRRRNTRLSTKMYDVKEKLEVKHDK